MSGFDFSNVLRNEHIGSHGPQARSTGTTIVGCLFEGGIVLGADSRATEGPIVADPRCQKIHFIADNIMCCGAGTAADTEFSTALISSNIALHALSTGRQPLVCTAMTMLKQMLFKHQGQIGAALVLGGIDQNGPHLFTIHPHGSTDKLPYVTMGSGSLAAMAVFESSWTTKLSRQGAIDLIVEAVEAGIFNDLGSGSHVDVCVIEEKGTEMMIGYKRPNDKPKKDINYQWRRGTTAYVKEVVTKFKVTDPVAPLVPVDTAMAIDV